ncbi:DUF4062 domain-containing protein [Comamonas sp.]|uniref:DUF4062 domain-containing protein n=1 Tax=Comamonas sp. TaxID=34028 RepID=UPI0026476C59|nr:DUF4062 domain-containing protein [Comamonas sp.]MDN5536595.1 DUF4062 domain-containing protein [Comamonas sp.]
MDTKKYQVFISSTYSDLVEEREGVIKAILEMYHIPIGMEMFSAEDEDQWEIIRRTIAVSDYYILILGLRYGSKTSEGISFTQKEYEYAKEIGIPILAFIMDDNVSLPKDKRDDDLACVNEFRSTVLRNSKMAQFWTIKHELIKNVSISLMKQIMQRPGIGWIRGDKASTDEALSKELAVLSKENRELRDRVSELESQVVQKKPEIEVSIQDLFVGENFDGFRRVDLPGELSFDSVPEHLKAYVSEGDVRKYNDALPTVDDMDSYNKSLELFYRRGFCSEPLVVKVCNFGNVKATNVYVDLTFPDGVVLFEEGESVKEPQTLIPDDPIRFAQVKYDRDVRRLSGKSPFLGDVLGRSGSLYHNPIFNLPRLSSANAAWWTRKDGNKLTIKINNLMHTRCSTFDEEYVVVPFNIGKHIVEVSVICEEMPEPVKRIVDMNVARGV